MKAVRILLLALGLVAATAAPAGPYTGLIGIAPSCALTSAGEVKCWGGERGGAGLPGGAKAFSANTPSCVILTTGGVSCSDTPPYIFTDVPGLTGVVQVASSGEHRCAVKDTGSLLCWGRNAFGALGDGTTTDSDTPVPVVGLGSPVSQVTTPPWYTCALTTAGGVKCWGWNRTGNLGNGTQASSVLPVDVVGLSSGVIAIAAGDSVACAVMATRTVKCWGALKLNYADVSLTPTDVPGLRDITAIAVFQVNACALDASGAVWCWGLNTHGQLGDGTFTNRRAMDPVRVVGLDAPAVSIAVGNAAACALLASGEGRCWGFNERGRLGFGFAERAWEFPVVMGDFVKQYLTFDMSLPRRSLGDPAIALSASASSGLPVSFTATDPTVCSVAGSTVTLHAAGVCTIQANQVGDGTYGRAYPVTRHFQVLDHVTPRLVNLSARGRVFTGNRALIAGFVNPGPDTKKVAIVATGYSLSRYGVTGNVYNPRIRLVRASDQQVVETSDYSAFVENTITVTMAPEHFVPDAAQILELGLAPPEVFEPALIADVAPGAYTAIVESDGLYFSPPGPSFPTNAGGIGVVGVYELDKPGAPLSNISARGEVLDGNDVMIAGFVIAGSEPRTVAIVGAGPSLVAHGVSNVLANPRLTLVRESDKAILASNNDWQDSPYAAAVRESGFAPSHSLEPAIVVTLPAGAYTAILAGEGGSKGIGVIGVYDVR